MIHIYRFLAFTLLFFIPFSTEATSKPNKILLEDPRWLAFNSEFILENAGKKIGKITRSFFTWDVEYEFYDERDQLQATALMKPSILPFIYTPFKIRDANYQLLGEAQETWYFFRPSFDIFNSQRKLIAACQSNFLKTIFTIKDSDTKKTLAVLKRPYFSWLGRSWSVTLVEPDLLAEKQISLPCIYLMAIYQSDKEKVTCLTKMFTSALRSATLQDTPFQDALDPFMPFLAQYGETAITAEDVEVALAAFEAKIATLRPPKSKKEKRDWNDSKRNEKAIQLVEQMVQEDELTTSQKCALIKLLKEKFNPLEES
jgi:hypothetical protein